MRYLLVISALFGLLCSCKPKEGTTKSEISPTTGQSIEGQSKTRQNANAVIDFRIKEKPEVGSVVVADYWQYQFIYEDGAMSKPGQHAHRWLDFKEDFTYEYGENSKTTGGGRYHHDMDTRLLVMLDNDPSIPPKEFETKFGGDLLIMIGKPTYGNNGTQMKLERIAAKPQ